MGRPTEREQIMRTSLTHPLMIDSFLLAEGKVGMTLCLGRKGPSFSGPNWDRNLQADILRLNLWRMDIVISLTPQAEMDHLDVGDMKAAMEGAGLVSDPRMHCRRAQGTTGLSSLRSAKHLGDFARNNSKG
jgi:ADP-ribosyl-[dinitrogen reductase] hydrolase